jgi:hypothetical protein
LHRRLYLRLSAGSPVLTIFAVARSVRPTLVCDRLFIAAYRPGPALRGQHALELVVTYFPASAVVSIPNVLWTKKRRE